MGVVVTAGEVTDAWPTFASLDTEEQGALVRVASQLIESYTRRQWTAAETTETYDGNGRAVLALNRYPVATVGTVQVDGVTVTDYVLKASSGQLVRGDTGTVAHGNAIIWDEGTQNISVTYTAGEGPPFPVRRAGVLLVKHLSQTTDAGAFRREKIGDYEYEMAGQEVTIYGRLPNVVAMLLAPYTDQKRY
jgi:hypothetical protein